MAGSQLKRLKASLRDQGIVGPQKSKKQKKKAAEEARARGGDDKRLRRSAALETIREQFNPFQFKMNARGPKFPVTSLKAAQQPEGLRGIKGRPEAALSRSEEKRRNKVGGILDRRLGEGDPNMTPEERALERFAFEKQRIHSKKGAVFDLEEDDFVNGDGGLTHMGRSLALGDDGEEDEDGPPAGTLRDDFAEDDLAEDDDDDDDGEVGLKKLKRMRSELLGEAGGEAGGEGAGDGDAPQRKKSKKEVMEEVIAKSKYYKYERQMAKEADDDVRAELDKMLPELQQLLATRPAVATTKDEKKTGKPAAVPIDKEALDKAYDVRLRQLIQDKKAEPSQRTKTEEELAAEQSAHLKKLEESRLRRMLGHTDPDDEEEEEEEDESEPEKSKRADVQILPAADGPSGADEFQLGQGIRMRHTAAADLGLDDEDDFLIEDDLVASEADEEEDDEGEEDEEEDEEDEDAEDEEDEDAEDDEDPDDDEFVRGLLTEEEKKSALFARGGQQPGATGTGRDDDGIPYTFACPQTHAELLAAVAGVPVARLPTVVQRIRALYHPKLDHGNKERLGRFAGALVEHVAYLADAADQPSPPPYATIESLVRHVHSLAKTVPVAVAVAFRQYLAAMAAARPLALRGGDLAVLAAVGAVFPTSDHFHAVVTPAMLAMGRYLEQAAPRTLADYATGLMVATLACQYQQRARRYVPELVGAVLNTLLALAPGPGPDGGRLDLDLGLDLALPFPVHTPAPGVRMAAAPGVTAIRKLRAADCRAQGSDDDEELKLALFRTALTLLGEATALWAGHAAAVETLAPARAVLQHLRTARGGRARLPAALGEAVDRLAAQVEAAVRAGTLARRPLELHHHRPLAIRTAVPRFEDEFDPDKHYDPDRARAEAAKLRAEYRREHKGAMRELRKDAGFLQREKLKLKKAQDAAYEKKYKRLVAEIQGSEGREANAYERERQARRRK